jgi:hypothetical protein
MTPNSASAVQLHRDYVYDTDLRELNLDGYDKYPERTIAFPVEIGANFKLGEKVDFRVSTAMHFTQTDLIDNVTYESVWKIEQELKEMTNSYTLLFH